MTPVPWNQQGCEVCRGLWEDGRHPQFVSVDIDERRSLHRCTDCGTEWRSSEEGVVALSAEGIYRGEPVTVSFRRGGAVLVGTADGRIAKRIALPQVGELWWQITLSSDDPELVHLTPGYVGRAHPTVSGPNRAMGGPFVEIDAIPGLAVRLSRRPDEGLQIAGQHVRGGSDYEYVFSIEPPHVPLFAEALGAAPGEVEDAWAAQVQQIAVEGEGAWLKRHGVPYGFFSYGTPIF